MIIGKVTHDPDAKLDYTFEWRTSGWLAEGESGTYTWSVTPETGLQIGTSGEYVPVSDDGGDVTVWILNATRTGTYRVTCHCVTDNQPARVEDWVLVVDVRD